MSDKIEPALTPEEWRLSSAAVRPEHARSELSSLTINQWNEHEDIKPEDVPKAIALANAALPDDDRRKITRARLAAVREALRQQHFDMSDDQYTTPEVRELSRLLDVLESYLPPDQALTGA